MFTFFVTGLILGVVARALANGVGDPQIFVTLPVAVGGAVIGGVGMNLVRGESWAGPNAPSFVSALVIAILVLGLVKVGVGRKSRHDSR